MVEPQCRVQKTQIDTVDNDIQSEIEKKKVVGLHRLWELVARLVEDDVGLFVWVILIR